ncbi:phage baseplate assembly protein V [Paenibacillus sp. 481]|uniref:phage baseplate assembly protein V n=1 Tax=Paenibacillus sp. 481 TaxID=2835869 RepID=UPI001E444FBA|nr:phage baseplate assembly protein V [Paenibacillus sp. 481]UHA74457.1 phage baseplate assembly protein V [Paenibacillus sp. 481]
MIRIGTVSSVNAAQATVRVTFADQDDIVSDELPIVFLQTNSAKVYAMSAVGDMVVCVFDDDQGFCIGSYYGEDDKPPTTKSSQLGVWFEDGSFVFYDSETKILNIKAMSGIVVEGKTTIKAPDGVRIEGNLTVTGKISHGGISP